MAPRRPLVSFGLELQPTGNLSPSGANGEPEQPKKLWYHYLPLCGTIILILAPHPSLLYVLVDFHLQTLQRPLTFVFHLLTTYITTFLAFSSLIVCVARDPGPVTSNPSRLAAGDNDELGLTEALMPDIDFSAPERWCRKCWASKPERAHHCSYCGRCVLKMDHHCPWLGSICIGHRTYPAFVHFLCCVTLLAINVAIISIYALLYAFNNPYIVNVVMPFHAIFLACMGLIFGLVIGPFLCYHLFLISTNQTTLENISPFLLLRNLPPLPHMGHGLSDPPLEPELSYTQRRLVKDAHRHTRLYDLGWRKNWAQVFGWKKKYGLLYRLWCGGSSTGDGKSFPRNPQSDDTLARLARELVKADRNA